MTVQKLKTLEIESYERAGYLSCSIQKAQMD